MWAGDRTGTTLEARFESCPSNACPGYDAWFAKVAAQLPGVTRNGPTQPTVLVDPGTGRVTISVFWLLPGEEEGAAPHHYDVEAQIAQ
jgi:hypothetical protein